MKYKRAVFFGCSMTAGSELADPYITGLSVEELYNIKRQKDYSNKTLTDFYKNNVLPYVDSELDLYKKEKSYSWAQKLSDKINLPCWNNAMHGASSSKFLYIVVQCLNELTDTDIVFIGLTHPQRLCIVQKDINPSIVFNTFSAIEESFSVSDSRELIGLLSYFNDEQWVIETLSNLHHIKLLLERKNIDVHFVHTMPNNVYTKLFKGTKRASAHNKVYNSSVNLYWKEICKKTLPVTPLLQAAIDDGFDFNTNNGKNLGFFHPIEKYHEIFANNVYEKLTELQII